MAVTLVARADRRAPNRLPTPACPRCGDDRQVVGTIRTRRFVYFRCQGCGELLPHPIPPLVLGHGLVAHLAG